MQGKRRSAVMSSLLSLVASPCLESLPSSSLRWPLCIRLLTLTGVFLECEMSDTRLPLMMDSVIADINYTHDHILSKVNNMASNSREKSPLISLEQFLFYIVVI